MFAHPWKKVSCAVFAGLVAGAILYGDADGAPRRRTRDRRPDPHECIFRPQNDVNGNVVVPNPANADQYARWFIWSRDTTPHDHKLGKNELAISAAAWAEVDKDKDGFLEIPEVTAYLKSIQKDDGDDGKTKKKDKKN